MDKVLKAKWAAALRSGDWKQVSGTLRRGPKGRCCLGVLLEVAGKRVYAGDRPDNYNQVKFILGKFGNGSGSQVYGVYTRLNDQDGATFVEIADYIEEDKNL